MAIRKIRVTNFKSFRDLEVELSPFSVLVGANASGKSNFVAVFEFLRDIVDRGLDSAISLQGGAEYMANINIGSAESFLLEVVFDTEFTRRIPGKDDKKRLDIEIQETTYRLNIDLGEKDADLKISADKLIWRCDCANLEGDEDNVKRGKTIWQGEIVFSHDQDRLTVDAVPPDDLPFSVTDLIPRPYREEGRLEPKTPLLEPPLLFFLMPPLYNLLDEIGIYEFDPKSSKKATPIRGIAELERDGSNLVIVLKKIMEDDEKKRKLLNLLKATLPFVDDMAVRRFLDRSWLFTLKETYSGDKYLPASSLSDGTINITMLIVALFLQEKPLILVEEPERNIHPHLISQVVKLMKEAEEEKQIIITTHNPEVVKCAGLEHLLLVSRDKDGFSTITRPANKDEVKTFLESEIGLDELFVQNLLEV